MKRSLAIVMVLISVASLSAQTWTGYPGGDDADQLRLAVNDADEAIRLSDAASDAALAGYRSLYVTARQNALSPAEYQARLQAETQQGAIPVGEVQAQADRLSEALATVRATLASIPPSVGSFSYRDAEQWLRTVASATATRITDVEALVGRIREAGQSDSDVEHVASGLGLPLPDEYLTATPSDQFIQVIGSWWLVFLAETGDRERSSRLISLASQIRAIDPDLAAEAVAVAASYRVAGVRFASATASVADALPTISAVGMLSVTSGTAMSGLIETFAASSRDELRTMAVRDVSVRFALETTEHLLRALTDRQVIDLAVRIDLPPTVIEYLRDRLFRVRLDLQEGPNALAIDAMNAAIARYRNSGDSRVDSEILEDYRLEGESYLTGLSPWLDEDKPRSGDSYRWAMLSVLSNRYAQRLILSSSDRQPEQRLVGEFVRDLYDRVELTAGREIADLTRDPAASAADSYDRVYELPAETTASEIESVYAMFMNIAEGDELIAGIADTGSLSQSIIHEWAHTHGFHLSIAGQAEPDGQPSWFDLAMAAENELQAMGFAIRGIDELGRDVRAVVEPAEQEAAVPTLTIYSPRLALAISLLSADRIFDVPPVETVNALRAVYDQHGSMGALFDAVEQDALEVAATVSDLERGDRRILRGVQ